MKKVTEKTGVIYCFVNKENNKKYIGRTLNFKHRLRTHMYRIESGLNNHSFYNDYRENPSNFEVFIIANDVPQNKLNELERFFIKFFDSFHNGYNRTNGGDTADHIKFTPERNKKISESMKRRKMVA